jgi:hypothetical protein
MNDGILPEEAVAITIHPDEPDRSKGINWGIGILDAVTEEHMLEWASTTDEINAYLRSQWPDSYKNIERNWGEEAEENAAI